MSDLISRKSVLDKLKDFSNMYTLEEEARIVLETIVRIVTEQPTAYSVGKVVAEIKELRVDDNYECIDIVEKGGVE